MAGRARSGSVEIWWDVAGDDDRPVVLLIVGAGSDALTWPPGLVDGLVDAGYRVVRFDPRDAGLSTYCTPDGEPYTLDDWADDTLAVLDDLGAHDAHVVGRSLGGFVAQVLALRNPERIRSLVLVYTSPGMPTGQSAKASSSHAARAVSSPGERPEEWVTHIVDGDRSTWGSGYPFDEEQRTAVARARVARGFNPYGSRGHGAAAIGAPSRLEALRGLDLPTLVVHGDEDPLVPYSHGEALVEAIPNAHLFTMAGVGHALPPGVLPILLPELVAHFDANESRLARVKADGCDLCEAARLTQWFHEDDVCWIAECEICAVPMVVWRWHGTEPSRVDLEHMLGELARVAGTELGAHYVDGNMRNIPDHFHAHARPEGGFFGPGRFR